MMVYLLKQFNTPLLKFSATENSNSPEVTILWVNEEKRHLLPKDLSADKNSLNNWLRHRTIPKNRAYVQNFLAKCGLNINRPMNIISVCKGLSLNDCYWIVEEGFEGTFENYNLYDNRFSRVLGLIAFTGYGSTLRSPLASCPEFTTNGMLPKCWRRVDGKIELYKGGTSGFSNTGNEPYSEFYAAQVAMAMGINAIPYRLTKWEGNLCSACELFTSKSYSFMPVGRIVKSGGFEAVEAYYKKSGDDYWQALIDMVVFDAVICNTDRHFGNFGFLIDNLTNEISCPAPLFDHGNSLFNFAAKDDLKSKETFQKYVDSLLPCVYDDFITKAKEVMNERSKEQLRHLLTFSFKKNPRYNLPNNRLKLIENQIQIRAKLLLD